MPSKCFIILLDCSAILLANSLIVITSGILTSRLTGFKGSLFSSFFKSLFSFCFALYNEAKLLPLVSISSLFKALEIVSLSSLRLDPIFPFAGVSPFNLFVARCSASFLFSKSFGVLIDGLVNTGFFEKEDVFDPKDGFDAKDGF